MGNEGEEKDMKTRETVKKEIRAVETSWKRMFSVENEFNGHLHRWQDTILYDMYDHNQFVPIGDSEIEGHMNAEMLTIADFEQAVEFQKKYGWGFLKFHSRKALKETLFKELKEKIGLDGGETYTMALLEKNTKAWKRNAQVTVQDVKTDNIANAIKEIEVQNYGHIYGENFTIRKTERYVEMAKKDENFHYFAAFLDGKIAGSCYAYVKDGYIYMDSLIVNEEVRKQYVATTLMAYIAEHFAGTMFLHADPEDTPKDMYGKMGFQVMDSIFEYTATWK